MIKKIISYINFDHYSIYFGKIKVFHSKKKQRFCAVPRFPFVVRTPTSFENVQEGIEAAEHMNKMSQAKEDVKVTFGYYVVDTSMYTKI